MKNKLALALAMGKLIIMCPSPRSEQLMGKKFKGSPGCTYGNGICDFCKKDMYLGTRQKEAYKTGKYVKICDMCFFKYAGKKASKHMLDNNMTSFQEMERETKH